MAFVNQFMDPKLLEILNDLTEPVPRSKLEPYREFILRLRRQGRSFESIREILSTRCSLKVSHGNLVEFVQRRARPRTAIAAANPEQPPLDPVYRQPVEREEHPRPRWTQEEIEAMRAKARASAHKPTTEPKPPPLFHYDPTRPLTNRPPDNKTTNK
jgi:hypothetical protein